MNRPKIYRVVVFILRALRWLSWWAPLVVAGDVANRMFLLDRVGASIGVGTSSFWCAELLAVFVATFATDRVLQLAIDDLRDRLG